MLASSQKKIIKSPSNVLTILFRDVLVSPTNRFLPKSFSPGILTFHCRKPIEIRFENFKKIGPNIFLLAEGIVDFSTYF